MTIGTGSWSGTYLGLYPSHAYAIIGYNAAGDTFTLYNPWGSNQPGQLSWSQLQSATTQLCVCDASGTAPPAQAPQSTGLSSAVSGNVLSAALVDALLARGSGFPG